jgi:UDP-N-acetylmuramoyl-L-alanyl-D-glutamate--2,6-diaminopimelate ligase
LIVVNADHASSEWLRVRSQLLKKDVYAAWYSKSEVQNFTQSFAGMEFDYESVHFSLSIFGYHMLENVLAATKACAALVDVPTIAKGLTTFLPPPGRMEIIQMKPFTVIIDFAHTPSSLERSLESIHELQGVDGRVITVFGCAGDRDRSRRLMGIPAAKYSKLVILTAEDPRNEDLSAINTEIYQVAEPNGAVMIERFNDHNEFAHANFDNLFAKVERVVENQDIPFVAFDEMSINSRLDAIEFALKAAQPGDIVYITGKGHEKSLCFIDTEFEWSDPMVVKNILQSSKSNHR